MGRPWLGLGLGLGLDWAPRHALGCSNQPPPRVANLAALFGRVGSTYTGSFGADEGKTAYETGVWLLPSGATA